MDSAPPPSLRSRLLTGFAGLLGAFVLYFLSIGPVGYVAIRTGIDIEPKPLEYFYAPLGWLIENTPLRQPMRHYIMRRGSRAYAHRNRHSPQPPPKQP